MICTQAAPAAFWIAGSSPGLRVGCLLGTLCPVGLDDLPYALSRYSIQAAYCTQGCSLPSKLKNFTPTPGRLLSHFLSCRSCPPRRRVLACITQFPPMRASVEKLGTALAASERQ